MSCCSRKRFVALLPLASPGSAFDLRSFCIIRETLSVLFIVGRSCFRDAGAGTYAISLAATEHVRDFWLARAATEKPSAAFALTEPDAGSDVAALKTTARREDDAYIIDGRKRFISNAGVADSTRCSRRTGPVKTDAQKFPHSLSGAPCPACGGRTH